MKAILLVAAILCSGSTPLFAQMLEVELEIKTMVLNSNMV